MSDLTAKEAIEILESQKNEHYKEEINEALDMAISALSENKGENKHGHWERDTEIDGYRCSNCGSTGMDYWNGCPYCLADMRESKGLTVKVGIVGKGKPSLLNQIIPKGEKGTE